METLHLQGIGKTPAIKAKELKPGMITVWNFVSIESGKEFIRTLRVDTLVAIDDGR